MAALASWLRSDPISAPMHSMKLERCGVMQSGAWRASTCSAFSACTNSSQSDPSLSCHRASLCRQQVSRLIIVVVVRLEVGALLRNLSSPRPALWTPLARWRQKKVSPDLSALLGGAMASSAVASASPVCRGSARAGQRFSSAPHRCPLGCRQNLPLHSSVSPDENADALPALRRGTGTLGIP